MAKEALLVVDMLRDFVEEGASLEVPAARAIIPNIQKRLLEARYKGMDIIYICDAHRSHDKEFTKWSPHALRGSRGAEIIKELTPYLGNPIVFKNTYSGFFCTDLAEILKGCKIEKVYITGVLTNVCVFFIAAEASMRGYEVAVCADSVAALSEADHQTALDQLERVLKIEVIR